MCLLIRTLALSDALLVALTITGCFPAPHDSCWVDAEGERLAIAYGLDYGYTVTERDLACVRGVRVTWTNQLDRWCGSPVACYFIGTLGRRDAVIIVSESEWIAADTDRKILIVRHELWHHLLRCIEGDADEAHAHPSWIDGVGPLWRTVDEVPMPLCEGDEH